MVISFWEDYTGRCEPQLRAAVAEVYDRVYDGHGNWVFNTAYAATQGFTASVRRFTSLNEVETWVKKGVPVVFSFAWDKGDLTDAAIPTSNGHLAVIVGFDNLGNPIVNDPAAVVSRCRCPAYLQPCRIGSGLSRKLGWNGLPDLSRNSNFPIRIAQVNPC